MENQPDIRVSAHCPRGLEITPNTTEPALLSYFFSSADALAM